MAKDDPSKDYAQVLRSTVFCSCLSISAIFHMHKIIRYFVTNSKLIVNNLQSVINNSVVRRYLLNKKKFIVIQLSLVYLNEVPFTFRLTKVTLMLTGVLLTVSFHT